MKYPFAPERSKPYAPKSMKNSSPLALALAGLFTGCVVHHKQPVVLQEPRVRHEEALAPAAFRKPLLSPGAQFGALPPAVQNTVIAEAGCEVIWKVVKDDHSGQPVYIIYFE